MVENINMSVEDEVCRNEEYLSKLDACEMEGICFISLPAESLWGLGGWHKTAVEVLRKLSKAQARTTGKEEDKAIRHFPLPELDGDL